MRQITNLHFHLRSPSINNGRPFKGIFLYDKSLHIAGQYGRYIRSFRYIFRQYAVSIYGFVRPLVSFACLSKTNCATSSQGRRLRFGMLMLTVLTNIRSSKVSW